MQQLPDAFKVKFQLFTQICVWKGHFETRNKYFHIETLGRFSLISGRQVWKPLLYIINSHINKIRSFHEATVNSEWHFFESFSPLILFKCLEIRFDGNLRDLKWWHELISLIKLELSKLVNQVQGHKSSPHAPNWQGPSFFLLYVSQHDSQIFQNFRGHQMLTAW